MGRGAGRRSPAGVHARGRSIGTALAGRCRTTARGGDSGSTAAVGSTAVWCRAVETSSPRQCPSRPLSWPALDRRHLLDAARLLCRHVHERALRRAPPRPQCRELARHDGTLPCVLSIQLGKLQARAASAAVARVTAVSAVATAGSGSAPGTSPRRGLAHPRPTRTSRTFPRVSRDPLERARTEPELAPGFLVRSAPEPCRVVDRVGA